MTSTNKTVKLAIIYRKPFKNIEKLTDVNYKVELIQKGKKTIDVVHVQKIIPYYEIDISKKKKNNRRIKYTNKNL